MFASKIRQNRISRMRCLEKFAIVCFSVLHHFKQQSALYRRDKSEFSVAKYHWFECVKQHHPAANAIWLIAGNTAMV
jgi:hypothetical protein